MKRLIISLMGLLFLDAAMAFAPKDSLNAKNGVILREDDPEIAAIDRILVASYLNHFCFSVDEEVLNAYGYQKDIVPTFTPEVVAERMRLLDQNTPFDLVYNKTVQGFIDLYSVRRRDLTSKVIGASELYFPMFEEALARHGIPMEMKYLAIVESALNPTAISPAGAGGLWQFMVSTGKMYGLDVTSYQDERFDPYKSTEAACQFLKFLYKTYGDWQLVLAAYNSGPGNVNKAIRRSGGKKDFWEIKDFLPKETQGYVPAFIAVNYVMHHATEYNIYPQKPSITFFEVDTLSVQKRLDFNVVSKTLEMPLADVQFLNGTYKLSQIPQNGEKHYVVLPISKIGVFMANDSLIYAESEIRKPVAPVDPNAGKVAKTIYETAWKYHKVKKSETLQTIAKKLGVTQGQLKKWNGIKDGKLKVGSYLKYETKVKKVIYVDPEPAPKEEEKKAEDNNTNSQPQEEKKQDNGESNTHPEEDEQGDAKVNDNQIDPAPKEEPKEQKVTEEKPKTQPKQEKKTERKEEYKYYTVKAGDNLSKIAQSKGTTVDALKKLNPGIKENSIKVGQKIKYKKV
ncbi:MAG: transglycosylase SLT domain-containing protein [Flavobacteriales bacterium]